MNIVYILGILIGLEVIILAIVNNIKLKGIKRLIFGEFYRDIGLGLIITIPFQWSILNPQFWIASTLAIILLGLGVRMKYKN